MSRSRHALRGLLCACVLGFLSLPPAAAADVSVEPAYTIVYVRGDEQPNQIVLECRGGFMSINGEAALDGRVSCPDLQKLRVFGFGGDDLIRLSGFGPGPGGLGGGFGAGYDELAPSLQVSGGEGNDDIASDGVNEAVLGGPGDDVLRGNGLFDLLLGGDGNDRLLGSSPAKLMVGGPGDDLMRGGLAFSIAAGGGGADTFVGGRGEDLAVGGEGPDKLAGHAGRDALLGGAGPDSLFGGPGRDLLGGGRGRDRIHGGPGRDDEFQSGVPRRFLRQFLKSAESAGPQTISRAARRIAERILALGS